MKKSQRMLALAGMTVFAGAAIGLSGTAAQAATNTDGATAAAKTTSTTEAVKRDPRDGRWDRFGHDTGRVYDIYDNRRDCEADGWWGEVTHNWEFWDCDYVGHGDYALIVERRWGTWHRGPGWHRGHDRGPGRGNGMGGHGHGGHGHDGHGQGGG